MGHRMNRRWAAGRRYLKIKIEDCVSVLFRNENNYKNIKNI